MPEILRMQTIVLATRNQGKLKEIRAILHDFPITFVSLSDYPEVPEVIEDGATLEANALKKAREIFCSTTLPALADDTGLEVFHLGMAPGVLSARYAGKNVSYEDNNKKLLSELHAVPVEQRRAQFRCVAAFVMKDVEMMTEGVCPGNIIDRRRGAGGFGYDPLFVPDGYDKTFAELPAEIKNQISHRAHAFRKMKTMLAESFIR